ncbi:hypothetical protein ACKI1Z_41975, partial [Streptomyces galilaeus]|uniref:hypothetical protein n=1 Tax=Streptomyces galilaeus TaxID=33899 RepID=UPI0038F814A3
NSYSRNSLEIVNVKENNDYNLRMMICEQFSDEPIWCIVDCDGEVVEEKLTLQKAKEHICDDIHVITCNLPIFGLKKVVEMI